MEDIFESNEDFVPLNDDTTVQKIVHPLPTGLYFEPEKPEKPEKLLFDSLIEDFSVKQNENDISLICEKTDEEILVDGPIFKEKPKAIFYCNRYLIGRHSEIIPILTTSLIFSEKSDSSITLTNICPSILQLILELTLFPSEFIFKRSAEIDYLFQENIIYLAELVKSICQYEFKTAKSLLGVFFITLYPRFLYQKSYNDLTRYPILSVLNHRKRIMDIIMLLNQFRMPTPIIKWSSYICIFLEDMKKSSVLKFDPVSFYWVYDNSTSHNIYNSPTNEKKTEIEKTNWVFGNTNKIEVGTKFRFKFNGFFLNNLLAGLSCSTLCDQIKKDSQRKPTFQNFC